MAKNVVRSSMKKVIDYYKHFMANDKNILYHRMKKLRSFKYLSIQIRNVINAI